MPYPDENCLLCPECGNPICSPTGETKETYKCSECGVIVHVHVWTEHEGDPAPIDARHIC